MPFSCIKISVLLRYVEIERKQKSFTHLLYEVWTRVYLDLVPEKTGVTGRHNNIRLLRVDNTEQRIANYDLSTKLFQSSDLFIFLSVAWFAREKNFL